MILQIFDNVLLWMNALNISIECIEIMYKSPEKLGSWVFSKVMRSADESPLAEFTER